MPGVSSTSSPRQGILGAAEFLASKGRNGDTQLTHTTTGETIVPEELLAKNPNLKKDLRLAFENEDIPMEQYVVGSGIMSVNPETGLYEAGWLKKTWKSVRKTVKKAGPVIGAAIGFVVGGPVGASIGAGVGTKTSAQDDYLRNMAIAFGASAGLQGAGMGGAFDAAKAARAAGGGFGSGVGAFFNPANWTPMAAGQTGLTGFFQNIGSGAARNLGLGGTASLQSAGLNAEQARLVQAEMARTGSSAFEAAMNLGITDTKILSALGSVAPGTFGPGVLQSGAASYSSLNPLQRFLLQTGFEQAMGIPEGQDGSSGVTVDSPYLTRPLTAGGNIPTSGGIPGSGIGTLPGSAGPTSMTTASINEDPSLPAYASAMNNITKGSTLLDSLSDRFNRAEGINAPALASLVSPFPEFEPPVYAQSGGLGSDLQKQPPVEMAFGGLAGLVRAIGPKLVQLERRYDKFRKNSRPVPFTNPRSPLTYRDAGVLGGLMTPSGVGVAIQEKRRRDNLGLANAYGKKAVAEGKTLDQAIEEFKKEAEEQGFLASQYYLLEVESGYKEATEPPSTRVYDEDMPRFRYGGSAVLNRPMFENGGIYGEPVAPEPAPLPPGEQPAPEPAPLPPGEKVVPLASETLVQTYMDDDNNIFYEMADGSFGNEEHGFMGREMFFTLFPTAKPTGKIHEGGGKVSGPGGEKDDMINAKLSNNEFVMTADAVRGAGNGDINQGANTMYALMDKFESMA